MSENKTARKNEKKDLITGLIVLFLYTAGIIFISSFHELWFDETQAWLIARCASYKEMFTYIPHYEGHPPLWHLLLSVFAKNGAPVDFTLKAINIVFSVTAMALLIFRSPFPKIVRYLLPFSFFFFYQYGVLSRPYSMAMIAFFLMAMSYKNRNTHPWRYIMSLVFLCLTSAFGIMIAGGLCIVWTFEIITELIRSRKMKFFWKDMRFYSLCFILVIAAALIVMIIPAEDCFYAGVEIDVPLIAKLKVLKCYEYIAILPFECWSGVILGTMDLGDILVLEVVEVICGLIIWGGLSSFAAKNKKFFTFFIPYIFMTSFMAFKYVSVHHLGLGALFHLFFFWIIAEQEGGIAVPEYMKKINGKIASPFIRKLVIGLGALICIAPVIYSGIASVLDISKNVGLSCISKTIKENHLEDAKIMAVWGVDYETDDKEKDKKKDEEEFDNYMFKVLEIPSEHEKIKRNNTYIIGSAAMIQPYFERNIFMNYNVDCPDDLYMHYKYKEDAEKVFEKWREKGLPEFIIGYCPIDEVYDKETLEGVRYLPVEIIEYNNICKVSANTNYVYLYLREDLFDDYPQFKWINDPTDKIFERKTS